MTLIPEQLVGQHVRLWPSVPGWCPRDTLYRLWAAIEQAKAGPQLFWGRQDASIHTDLTAFVKFMNDPGRQLVLVTDRLGRELAGCVWFDDVIPGYRCFESIFITPAYWGESSLETLQLVFRYAFDELGVQQVWAATPWQSAKRLGLRAGFTVEAVLRGFALVSGRPRDVTFLKMERAAWAARYGGSLEAFLPAARPFPSRVDGPA